MVLGDIGFILEYGELLEIQDKLKRRQTVTKKSNFKRYIFKIILRDPQSLPLVSLANTSSQPRQCWWRLPRRMRYWVIGSVGDCVVDDSTGARIIDDSVGESCVVGDSI